MLLCWVGLPHSRNFTPLHPPLWKSGTVPLWLVTTSYSRSMQLDDSRSSPNFSIRSSDLTPHSFCTFADLVASACYHVEEYWMTTSYCRTKILACSWTAQECTDTPLCHAARVTHSLVLIQVTGLTNNNFLHKLWHYFNIILVIYSPRSRDLVTTSFRSVSSDRSWSLFLFLISLLNIYCWHPVSWSWHLHSDRDIFMTCQLQSFDSLSNTLPNRMNLTAFVLAAKCRCVFAK